MVASAVAKSSPVDLVPNAVLAVDVVLFTLRKGPPCGYVSGAAGAPAQSRWDRSLGAPGSSGSASESFAEAARRSLAEKAGIDARTGTSSNWRPTGNLRETAAVGVASIAHVALVRSDDIFSDRARTSRRASGARSIASRSACSHSITPR